MGGGLMFSLGSFVMCLGSCILSGLSVEGLRIYAKGFLRVLEFNGLVACPDTVEPPP